jgi:hypothetical protein
MRVDNKLYIDRGGVMKHILTGLLIGFAGGVSVYVAYEMTKFLVEFTAIPEYEIQTMSLDVTSEMHSMFDCMERYPEWKCWRNVRTYDGGWACVQCNPKKEVER